MTRLVSLLLGLTACASCLSLPRTEQVDWTKSVLVEHETVPAAAPSWIFVKPALDDTLLNLKISLFSRKSDYLDLAHKVSDPSSPHCGQFLDAAELRDITGPSDSSVQAILQWLQSIRAKDIVQDHRTISFDITVAQAKVSLAADFAYYSARRNGKSELRTKSYSIPEPLKGQLDFIYPTIHFFDNDKASKVSHDFPELRRRQRAGGPVTVKTCANSICPKNLTERYNINYIPPNLSKSKIGVAGFLEEQPSYDDLDLFFNLSGLSHNTNPTPPFTIQRVNGGLGKALNKSQSTVEAQLDLQYTTAFLGPLNVTFISTGGRAAELDQPGNKPVAIQDATNEPWMEFLTYLLEHPAPPQVLSMSWTDDEITLVPSYARKVCDLFAQLSLRGVSAIVASGDGGTSGTRKGSTCKLADGVTNSFVATFPASCPWVTTVGALHSANVPASYSTGGFSDLFPMPGWQKNVTAQYVKALNGSHAGWYNASGRAYPDVSLLGNEYLTVSGGATLQSKGTSASTPLFATMITLINDIRLRAGKPVLGFLNPLLYSDKVRSVYTDITSGEISGCATSVVEPGFQAIQGWDAATGFGAVDFAKLRAALS